MCENENKMKFKYGNEGLRSFQAFDSTKGTFTTFCT